MRLQEEIPEEKQNEYYRPIDGICPEEHIEIYKILLNCL